MFFVLWFICLRGLKKTELKKEKNVVEKSESTSVLVVIKNRNLWLLTICILAFMIAVQGILAFYPTFFTQVKGMESMKAVRITGMHGYIGCVGAVVSGYIMDKTGAEQWKRMGALVRLISAVLFAVLPGFPVSLSMVIILLIGFATNMMPPLIYAMIPNVCRAPQDIPVAMGIVNTGMNFGTFVSAILFGTMIDSFGWTSAFLFAAVMAIICVLCMMLLKNVKNNFRKTIWKKNCLDNFASIPYTIQKLQMSELLKQIFHSFDCIRQKPMSERSK